MPPIAIFAMKTSNLKMKHAMKTNAKATHAMKINLEVTHAKKNKLEGGTRHGN